MARAAAGKRRRTSAPELQVPAGKITPARIQSAVLGNERAIWVYAPPGYDEAGAPLQLLLLFDGAAYVQAIPAPATLDILLASGRIAPTVAVLIDSLDEDTRDRELPCHAPTVEFLAGELLPWVHARWNVSAAPTTIGGSSYGGLAAAFVAFRAPELFGQVLAQSGSFWWRPPGEAEHEWLTRQFVASTRLPLRFYLSVGRGEARARIRPNQLIASRHMRDVLLAKGYPVHYAENDGKHDYAAWRAGLADALTALLGSATERNSDDLDSTQ